MKVAIVITRLNIGGATPMAIGLADGLRKFDHETMIVTGTPEPGEGTLEHEAEALGIRVERIPALRRNPHPRDVVALWSLVGIFRRWRPDLVLTHMSKAGALGRAAARLAGVPAVHTYHGKGFHVFKQRWKERSALASERLLARLGAGSIVVSEIQRKEFVELGIDRPERLKMIHYGLALDPFLEAAGKGRPLRIELGAPDDAVLVGVVGRVIGIKGQDVFIRAAARLSPRFPRARFLIVGDGADRSAFEQLAASLGANAVQFLGWRRDIPSVLASLDVVVLPTTFDFEGVPVSVIEALAVACPVVATDVGGVREAVRNGQTGLLVPPRDDAALAEAIARMIESPETAAAMGHAGQTLVKTLFGVDRFLREHDKYIREVAAR
jgi:glycosyltransferase involved in cell wall biosynthesis